MAASNPDKIRVCAGVNCMAKGARLLMRRLESETGVKAGTAGDRYDLDYCACTGYCHLAPNVVVNGNFIHEAEENTLAHKVEEARGLPEQTVGLGEADLERILQDELLGEI